MGKIHQNEKDKFHVGAELFNSVQGRGENADIFTQIIGKLLEQAVLLVNCVPFEMRTSLKGKNLLL